MNTSTARLPLLAIVLLVAACGDDDPNVPIGGNGGGGSAARGGSDAGGGGSESAPPILTCQRTCTAASDCAGDIPIDDADNWSCDDGVCVSLGCNSTLECEETFGANYACDTRGPVSMCVETCETADDCAGMSPLFDADNWACESNRCVYQGCASTSECTESLGTGSYVCEPWPGSTIPSCRPTCGSAADCATPTPIADTDNWACVDQRCSYLGCHSTAECRESLASQDYVCR